MAEPADDPKGAAYPAAEDSPAEDTAGRQREEARHLVLAAKRAYYLCAIVLAGGLILCLCTILLLQLMHASSAEGRAMDLMVAGENPSSLTLKNISWPASSLGWAAAVAFLGFALAMAAGFLAIGTALSRIANGDH